MKKPKSLLVASLTALFVLALPLGAAADLPVPPIPNLGCDVIGPVTGSYPIYC